MKLATIDPKSLALPESRNGRLVIVNPPSDNAALVPLEIAPDLLTAIENWNEIESELQTIDNKLRSGSHKDIISLSNLKLLAPLPRTFGFLDGSAFLSHVRRVRKSRGADMPPELEEIPLMYQGISDSFLAPTQDITIIDEAHGVDFEAEVAVVVDHVPMQTTAASAISHIKLLVLLNDISLRNLIPAELARGFGFLHGKPASSLGPYAVTPDELGDAWHDGKANLQIRCILNGKVVGELHSSEMHFSFGKLIEHAAHTRSLSAGTILGSGTVSNDDEQAGIGCLVERRVLEIINSGSAKTNYLKIGDNITIEATLNGQSIFGSISQTCRGR